jgi:glycosyltransferase involved in cell wall biosynthesis
MAVKILWMSDIARTNSFAKVTRDYLEMIRVFLPEYQLMTIDIGERLTDESILERIVRYGPDVLLMLYNDNTIKALSRILPSDRWQGRFVAFLPIDYAKPAPADLGFSCHLCLTMNSWGADQIRRVANGRFPVGVLHHLVEDFYESSQNRRISLRKKFYGSYHQRFIVGMVNANNCRKRIDLSIEAFRHFAQRVPDSLLVIKTTRRESMQLNSTQIYQNLSELVRGLPVIILTDHFTDQTLNELYNTFDLMINTTDGEGFGLTPFEAALAGVLSILPWHSSFKALLPGKERPQYTVEATPVPFQYARNCSNYLDYRRGSELIYLLEARAAPVPSCRSTPFQIDPGEGSSLICLTQLDKPRLFGAVAVSDLASALRAVREGANEHFQLAVTSDLESIRAFCRESVETRGSFENRLQSLDRSYQVLATSLEALNQFAGEDQPQVGVVDPVEVCQKMTHYYHHPEQRDRELRELQQHVRQHFSSERVSQEFRRHIEQLVTC